LWLATHGSAIAAAAHHAETVADSDVSGALAFLTESEAADVEAIAACIIPSGATAGAREAHVVVFIDHSLHTFFGDRAVEFRQGLTRFQQAFAKAHADTKGFATADEAGQIAFLTSVEDTPFFGVMFFLTVLGFLSSPRYGGNAQKVGWKAIGFVDQHIFTSPFGHYDRDYPGFQPYPAAGAAK
jgi:gluconate 2-dehydrogenase gamma chain